MGTPPSAHHGVPLPKARPPVEESIRGPSPRTDVQASSPTGPLVCRMNATQTPRSKRVNCAAAAGVRHCAGDTFTSSANPAGLHDAWPAPQSQIHCRRRSHVLTPCVSRA
jgi:hypothetical protein